MTMRKSEQKHPYMRRSFWVNKYQEESHRMTEAMRDRVQSIIEGFKILPAQIENK